MKIFSLFSLLLVATLMSAQSWKSEAESGIKSLRTAPVSIRVVDAQGIQVEGARITLKMQNHAFKWGTTSDINYLMELEREGFGLDANHPYMLHFHHFNSVTPNNAGKWKFWLDPTSRKKYLETLSWFDQNAIANRGHTTIWSSITRWNAVPGFVVHAEPEISDGVVVKTKEEVVRKHIKDHIESQLSVLEEYLYELDLVNELVNEAEIVKLVLNLPAGERPKEHAQWYKWAKSAAPAIDLVANEYNLFQSGNNFHLTFVDYIRKMLAEGAPVDVIGMQGHFFGDMPSYQELKKRLSEVAVLGLPMVVTEFDMKGSSYTDMERVLYAVFSEPLVHGFTMWGAWDGKQWRNNAAMYNQDWTIKESGRAWLDLVKGTWWTDTTGISTQDPFTKTGYLGDYKIFIERDSKVYIHEAVLDKSGLEIVVQVDSINTILSSAKLVIEDDLEHVYAHQPVNAYISSADSILSVTYFDNAEILGFYDQYPFIHTFSLEQGSSANLYARIEFSNGYEHITPTKTVTASLVNANPVIKNIFPPMGATLLEQMLIEIYITATDPNDDPVTFVLLDAKGKQLTTSEGPHPLLLHQLALGPNYFTVRVEDDKFGFVEQFYFVNILKNVSEHSVSSTPLSALDDIEEKADGVIDIHGDLDLGEKLTGIRFPLIKIPERAQIDSAHIQFYSEKNDQTGQTVCLISGEKQINAAPFSSARYNLSQRNKTDSIIRWSPDDWLIIEEHGIKQKTPDLSIIIDEMVSQKGWTEDSPVHLFVDIVNSPSKRSAFSYDQVTDFAPVLTVHYRADFVTDPPDPPTGFGFEKITDDVGTLSWQTPASNQILGYKLFVNDDSIPITTTGPVFTFTGLELDRDYKVVGQTIGQYGIESVLSEPFMFNLSTTALEDIRGRINLEVYPNPTNDILQVDFRFEQSLPADFILMDLNGVVVKEGKMFGYPFALDLSDFQDGWYALQIKLPDKNLLIHTLLKQ